LSCVVEEENMVGRGNKTIHLCKYCNKKKRSKKEAGTLISLTYIKSRKFVGSL
jgi:hypothetical protein